MESVNKSVADSAVGTIGQPESADYRTDFAADSSQAMQRWCVGMRLDT